MAQKGRGIFMVYVDIDAQHVQEFNEWYNKEHLPELLSVPGILSAARYEAVKGGPQYLACYELESVAVMQTPAFYQPAADAVGTASIAVRDWEEFDTHCRGTDVPGTALKCRIVAWRRCCRLAACPSPPRSRRRGTPGTAGNMCQATARYRA